MINPTLMLSETIVPPADGKTYGIHTATEGFLKAYIRHGNVAQLRYVAANDQQNEAIIQFWNKEQNKPPLARVYSGNDVGDCALYYNLPNTNHVWMREYGARNSYSICGINHTLSGFAAYDNLRQLFFAPADEWDAIICTSHASKNVIQKAFDNWTEYLSERTTSRITCSWNLPVIPLGIDAHDLNGDQQSEAAGRGIRSRLAIPDQALVVLFLGRLNFTSKAHPFPMFLALERAREQLGHEMHLIQAGWFPSDQVENATMELARQLAPSVAIHNVGAVSGANRTAVFSAADIFISLTDNIQETFGLSVVEAMACERPVVVSDWDGYRDTVVDGKTGFLVPTAMPAPGNGSDIASLHGLSGRPYNRFLADVSQATAVNIEAATEFIVRLGSDANLRREMGRAGRQRVLAHYDWSKIIPLYQELWTELNGRRIRAKSGRAMCAPGHPDPFSLFGNFASHTVDENTIIRLGQDAEAIAVIALRSPTLRASSDLLISDDVFREMMASVAHHGRRRICDLLDLTSSSRQRALRCILWGIKVGVFEPIDLWP